MATIVADERRPELEAALGRVARHRGAGTAPDSADISVLIAAARGTGPLAGAVPRPQLLRWLADALSPAVAAPVLAEIAEDASAPLADRIAAVGGLSRAPGDRQARATLLARAADADVRLRGAAYAALAEIADEQDLTALDETADAVRPLLAFARAVTAHRAGVDRRFLPDARVSPRRPAAEEPVRPVELAALPESAAAEALAQFQGPSFGIEPAPDVHRLSCGIAEWNLIGNAELGGFTGSPERLLERPWILALVALLRPLTPISDTQFVVLSRPSGEQVALEVVRTDGLVAYLGAVVLASPEPTFRISDADQPQTVPTELAGTLGRTGIQLSSGVVAVARTGLRETEPAVPARG